MLHATSCPATTRVIDLRRSHLNSAREIINEARLQSADHVLLTPSQQQLLTRHLLRDATALLGRRSEQRALIHSNDPLCSMINELPAGLLQTCALHTAIESLAHEAPDAADADNEHESHALRHQHERRLDHLARVAVALLERCERENRIAAPSRLFLATEAIHQFPWHTPVHEQRHLLLLAKIALALGNGMASDTITVQSIVQALAHEIDDEQRYLRSARRSGNGCETSSNGSGKKVVQTPRGLLQTLMEWGVNPHLRNNNGECVVDILQRKGHVDIARTLDSAIGHCEACIAQANALQNSSKRALARLQNHLYCQVS